MERLREELDKLSLQCYGEQWLQVYRHNVECITGNTASEANALTAEQLQKLVNGMKKWQGKRNMKA